MAARIVPFAIYVALPIVGLVFFGWDWRPIVVLYWFENITLGVLTVVSMLRAPRVEDDRSAPRLSSRMGSGPTPARSRSGYIGFFFAHYGAFTLVHGIFVFALTSGAFRGFRAFGASGDRGSIGAATADPIPFTNLLIIWGVGSLVQLVWELLRRREDLPSVARLFGSPYRRVMTLHVAILGGAFLISRFDWPPITAVLLVAAHFAMDVHAARREKAQTRAGVRQAGASRTAGNRSSSS